MSNSRKNNITPRVKKEVEKILSEQKKTYEKYKKIKKQIEDDRLLAQQLQAKFDEENKAPTRAPKPTQPPVVVSSPSTPPTVDEICQSANAVSNATDANTCREKLNKAFRESKSDGERKKILAAQIKIAEKGFAKSNTCAISLEDFDIDTNGKITSNNAVILADGSAYDLESLVRSHNTRRAGTNCGQAYQADESYGDGTKYLINPSTQLPCSPEEVQHVQRAIEKHNANPANTAKLNLEKVKGNQAPSASARQAEPRRDATNPSPATPVRHRDYPPRLFNAGQRHAYNEDAILAALLLLEILRSNNYLLFRMFVLNSVAPTPVVGLQIRIR